MTWIKTLSPTAENSTVREALQKLIELYPREYNPARRHERILPDAVKNDSIMLSHSLIPQAMFHAFATFGSLMDPALPLTRRQHEMIATTVSTLNKCFY
jgi:alkylhydroperoxidase family enzyme